MYPLRDLRAFLPLRSPLHAPARRFRRYPLRCLQVYPLRQVRGGLPRSYTAEQIYAEIAKERPFFESSGGGVTFSGGEPLYQGESIIPLLDFISEAAARDGYTLHRTLDTTLSSTWTQRFTAAAAECRTSPS